MQKWRSLMLKKTVIIITPMSYITIGVRLSFSEHLSNKINKANKIIVIFWLSFTHLDLKMFKGLYTAPVRPHLEYGNHIWCQQFGQGHRGHRECANGHGNEITCLMWSPWKGWIAYIRWLTAYKSTDQESTEETFKERKEDITRGNSHRLFTNRATLDLRKYAFPHRVEHVYGMTCLIE